MAFGQTRGNRRRKWRKVLLTAVVVVAAVVIAGVLLARHYWPFTESAVRKELQSASGSKVRFGSFHAKYFPPGCVAEDVLFQRDTDKYPLIAIRRLVIRSYLGGILHGHVSLIRAEGMHVILSHADVQKDPSAQRIVDRLVADGAVMELRRKNGVLRFVFHKFLVKDVNSTGPSSFDVVFENPMPAGLIRTSGKMGPWNKSHSEDTPISGKYSLENANLGVFGGIGGILSSDGTFHGSFGKLDVEGSTTTPGLEVTKTHHALPLDTHFNATINATSGDVVLHKVRGKFGRSDITTEGTIGRQPDGKRAAVLSLACDRGRIEDVFYPFIHSPKSPLSGDVDFKMQVVIPPGQDPFLKKVDLHSDFKIYNAQFTNTSTQARLNKIAEKPNQKKPTETLSDFQGTVALRGGVAHFSQLSVHDQDAAATFHGSYNLIDERVNISGQLKTATSLTKATHGGLSAVFAKVLQPFFKKKPHDTVVPVKISGTYSHPSFGLNL